MNANFKEYAEILEKIEVLTITITPEGEYHVPSEKKGKITEVSTEQRARLRSFLIGFACRLNCGELEESREKLQRTMERALAEFVPMPAEPKKARSA